MGKWRRAKSLSRRWQRNHLIAKYGNQCYLCADKFKTIKDITLDHWVPLSKSGEDILENYRLAHLKCNQLKGAMSPDEFQEFQLGLIKYE